MRGQNLITLLEYEAKRQPALATLIANLDRLSHEDIQTAEVRLPWMRQALLQMKQDHAATAVLDASCIITSVVPDPQGEMREWTGDPTFVRVGGTHLEVMPGQLLWFGQTGVWLDTIYSKLIDPQLYARTVTRGQIAKSGYLDAVRNRARRLSFTAGPTDCEPMAGVRFYTPG